MAGSQREIKPNHLVHIPPFSTKYVVTCESSICVDLTIKLRYQQWLICDHCYTEVHDIVVLCGVISICGPCVQNPNQYKHICAKIT